MPIPGVGRSVHLSPALNQATSPDAAAFSDAAPVVVAALSVALHSLDVDELDENEMRPLRCEASGCVRWGQGVMLVWYGEGKEGVMLVWFRPGNGVDQAGRRMTTCFRVLVTNRRSLSKNRDWARKCA